MNPHVLMVAGGTGGHIYPALAAGNALKKSNEDIEVTYCCGNREGELAIYKSAGIEPWSLPLSGRRPGFKNTLQFLIEFVTSIFQARRQLKTLRPALIVSFGNYNAIAVWLAARGLGAKVAVQEQNAYPGMANRWLGKRADLILTGVPVEPGHFPESKTINVGNPVRKVLLGRADRARARKHFGLADAGPVCLIFGGSLGARGVNRLVQAAFERQGCKLDPGAETCETKGDEFDSWSFIWATGPSQYDDLSAWLDRMPETADRIRLIPYIDQMDLAYGAADLVVCRSGALTLAELTVQGLPSVLVPLPHSAGDHQRANARVVEVAGAAWIIEENDEDGGAEIAHKLQTFTHEPDTIESMRKAARKLAKPDAAEQMADAMMKLL